MGPRGSNRQGRRVVIYEESLTFLTKAAMLTFITRLHLDCPHQRHCWRGFFWSVLEKDMCLGAGFTVPFG
jgi:hypothetical protein